MENERLRISGGFYVGLAFLLLIVPLRWIFAALIAASFHEFCHWTVIRLTGGRVDRVGIGASGAKISLTEMSGAREAICALAGPLGSLSLLFVMRWMPRVSICGLFQGLYNLLPLYPLDGGRALRCGLSYLFSPPQTDKICNVISAVVKFVIFCLSIYGCIWLKFGLFPLLLSILLLIRVK